MIKKTLFFCMIINILNMSQVLSFAGELPSRSLQERMKNLSNVDKTSTKIGQDALPAPYHYLLTQPLMTKGIEHYYQSTPFIHTIYAIKNAHNHTYSRAIMMLINTKRSRNNVVLAQRKKEATVVELAFITMNFKALPKKIREDVLNTNVPFGKLLSNHHVEIYTTDRTYFWIMCNKELASLTHCDLNTKLYGRTNTIIKAENNKWLAHVVEILP